MSALARYFKSRGVKVSGYDKTETPLTRQLQLEGIDLHFEDNVNLVDHNADLVIYTPAIPKEHNEYQFLLQNGYPILKRSEVLGLITAESLNICVAGTHGKTTTSTMIAHILRHSGFGCNAFLGGISANYDTNFWSSRNNVCVVEADEYDRSFLKLKPDVAVITAIDPDHLDIYQTEEKFREAFIEFASKIKNDGLLIYKLGLENEGLGSSRQMSYSLNNEHAAIYAKNINHQNGAYTFDIVINDELISGFKLQMGGMHNIENMVAAIAVARHCGLSEESIKKAVSTFKGVKRRFEYIINEKNAVMIDDYAHHPEELKTLIQSAKSLFPGFKCTVIFQPHLYSRTRDFASGFSDSLSLADEVYVLPIYPAREKEIPGVNSELIVSRMDRSRTFMCSKEKLLEIMEAKSKENSSHLLITSGAGDIDAMVKPISLYFKKENNS
ncbi:MAG: UDP-N-acetylmuramate--L-alanine ligase [Ferruginibacter sp.]|nr:UDP-N-acetylmuramate--L-alanine ligase [Ferruginibacter sp.]